jgi:hypothetical protein
LKKIAIVGLALVIALGVSVGVFCFEVYSAYEIWSSKVNVSVSEKADLTLEANVASGYVGDTIQLTAFLTDGADDETIYFYENTVEIGSVVTSGGGYAVLDHQLEYSGNREFEASCMHTE